MKVDFQAQKVLDVVKNSNKREFYELTLAEARAEYLNRTNKLKINLKGTLNRVNFPTRNEC